LQEILDSEKDSESIHKIIIVGDLNADPNKGNFWPEMERFLENTGLFVADSSLPIDSFTYLSPAHNSTSWLDHILVSDKNCIKDIEILYGKTLYDHIPVSFEVEFPIEIGFKMCEPSVIDIKDFVLWDKLSAHERKAYNNGVQDDLQDYCNESLLCKSINCNLESHKKLLDNAYDFLINTLKSRSAEYTIKGREKKFKQVPGWNQECKCLHSVARDKFLTWNSNGRIRFGLDFDQMKSSRATFRRAFDKCKHDEEDILFEREIFRSPSLLKIKQNSGRILIN
jgi:hypothetical protein